MDCREKSLAPPRIEVVVRFISLPVFACNYLFSRLQSLSGLLKKKKYVLTTCVVQLFSGSDANKQATVLRKPRWRQAAAIGSCT